MEETLRHLLALYAGTFERLTGTPRTVISRRALDDSRYLDRVLGGDGFTVRTFDRALAFLSYHWPDGEKWPEGAPRPSKSQWIQIKADAEARALARRSDAAAPALRETA